VLRVHGASVSEKVDRTKERPLKVAHTHSAEADRADLGARGPEATGRNLGICHLVDLAGKDGREAVVPQWLHPY
jgi:hypothetical protein